METHSRREILRSCVALLTATALPNLALAEERNEMRRKIGLPDFQTYQNPHFGRREHEALHADLEAKFGFANDPNLTRWHSDPNRVYVNENAGESIHITGVNLEENYAEMIWVLAPAYVDENGEQVVAHVPFEHEHSNQAEEFEKIMGEVSARVNGVLMEGEETDFFTAEPEDDHIAWNPENTPMAMRVRYYPGFEQDGEKALMVYWGFVNNPNRTKAEGQPKNLPLLAALNAHLKPKALPSNMPRMVSDLAQPFLVNELNRNKVAALYQEITGEMHPLA